MSHEAHSLESISGRLLSTTNLVRPPQKAQDVHLTAKIADLRLHPAIEALLHILNADLPSAHFLVRRMQAPPAVEGMLLHSILHRAEGDFNNARAWMGDVVDACEGWVPKQRSEGQRLDHEIVEKMRKQKGVEESLVEYAYREEDPKALTDDVESFRKTKGQKTNKNGERIEERIRSELSRILEWCAEKFGREEWADASSAWTKDSEEINATKNDMVSGTKGYRKF